MRERMLQGVDGGCEIISRIEKFINEYVKFTDAYSLPIALWVMATYVFSSFDAFPYMVITAETKRSGKTRLAEMISFCCSNPRFFTAMTPSTMFNIIEAEHPTVIFDEAETLSGESQSVMSQVLNAGYRKGTRIPRMVGKDQWKEYDTYSPKIFILIGDVRDTLRDRSIIVRMRRAVGNEIPARFVHETVKSAGETLREDISELVQMNADMITQSYLDHAGISFLTDRDEEIWTPIFTMAQVFCPSRIPELERIAVDMATEKTAPKRRYVELQSSEDSSQDDEYALRLLEDMIIVMNGKPISSQDAVTRLREIPTAPWRKFRGDGITMHNIADMLSRFGVRSSTIRIGSAKKGDNRNVFKGYKPEQVREAIKKHRQG
jgi:Protein of unknown function (DUF3631)